MSLMFHSFAFIAARFLSDPKLLHSDFYTLKYSYDTFALEFKLEYLVYKGYGVQDNAP
jgi:hypothetical protein